MTPSADAERDSWDRQRFRVFILGAGFSRPAGYPLAPELWEEIRARARGLTGRAAKFHDDIDSYIEFRRDCDGIEIQRDQVDLEDLCKFLDIEHFLGMRGSDTWSEDGNEGTIVMKHLMAEILTEATPDVGSLPSLYLSFAESLQPNDIVITFNYDTLLEMALEAVRKPYRLSPRHYKLSDEFRITVDMDAGEVVVLKMHGSIDWFDKSRYLQYQEQGAVLNKQYRPAHPVFGESGDAFTVRPVVSGPSVEGDPLAEMYRLDQFRHLYKTRNWMFLACPWLLAPSTMKIVYSQTLGEFWHWLSGIGSLNFGMAIIGYSLPDQDDYARQLIHGAVTAYQRYHYDEEVLGKRKRPLVIVDHRPNSDDERAFRERYRFVDWDRAIGSFNGFDEACLELIF